MEAAFDKRQATISQQLMILRDAGLVASRKDGLQVFYRLIDEQAAELLEVALGPAEPPLLPGRSFGAAGQYNRSGVQRLTGSPDHRLVPRGKCLFGGIAQTGAKRRFPFWL